jgi:beta-lactamase class A
MHGYAEEPEVFLNELRTELEDYINPYQGKITLHYLNLESEISFNISSGKKVPAASRIKLPLAIYVMTLVDKGEMDLTEKLSYKSHHYYGGSGVIQNDKIGSSYSIEDLVEKALVYSDNIAFIMLKERVGQKQFIQFMKRLGAAVTYPDGQNLTSASDLILYAKELYRLAKVSENGAKLINYLENTIYNTTIPHGITGKNIAHKVGMIPKDLIYNDVALVYDKQPFALAVTTEGIGYEKSQQVIADIANIVNSHHELIAQENSQYTTVDVPFSKLESIYYNDRYTTEASSQLRESIRLFDKYRKPLGIFNKRVSF